MGAFAFRRLTDDDLPALVGWTSAEHARPWFDDEPRSVEDARRSYARELLGASQTQMWVVELAGLAIGYLQDYPVSAYDDYAVRVKDPQAVAFDFLIGDPQFVGKGVGVRMIRAFCAEVLCRDHPDAPRFVASPDVRNARSIRTLERAGFTRGLWIHPESVSHPEVVCTAPRGLFE